MIIVDKETLETCDAEDLRNQYRHIMFDFTDPEIVGEVLESIGKAVLNMPDQPMFDSRYQKVEVGEITENEGVYSSSWILSYIEFPPEDDLKIRRELIANKRFEVETGGIEIGGVKIPTNRETQQVLAAMYVRAIADSGYTVKFKSENGFVDLMAEQIIAIASAVHDHVQQSFNRESDLLVRLSNGESITPEDWQ